MRNILLQLCSTHNEGGYDLFVSTCVILTCEDVELKLKAVKVALQLALCALKQKYHIEPFLRFIATCLSLQTKISDEAPVLVPYVEMVSVRV